MGATRWKRALLALPIDYMHSPSISYSTNFARILRTTTPLSPGFLVRNQKAARGSGSPAFLQIKQKALAASTVTLQSRRKEGPYCAACMYIHTVQYMHIVWQRSRAPVGSA